MTKQYVVLETNPECGDKGGYCGSVIGIYRGTVSGFTFTEAVEKFIEHKTKEEEDFGELSIQVNTINHQVIVEEDTIFHFIPQINI